MDVRDARRMTADHLDRINPARPRMAGIDGEPHVRPGHGKEAIEILLPLDDHSQMVVIRAAHTLTRKIIGNFGQSPAELLPRSIVEPRCPRNDRESENEGKGASGRVYSGGGGLMKKKN